MKRHEQLEGIRYWTGDDFIEIQNESLTVLDNFFAQYGDAVLNGCIVSGNAISSGIVSIDGRVMPFAGVTGITAYPIYIVASVSTVQRVYVDGVERSIANVYTAVTTSSKPSNKGYIEILGDGAASRFLKKLESIVFSPGEGTNSGVAGTNTSATGGNSTAIGQDTTVSGDNAHGEGRLCEVTGTAAHAEGAGCKALADYAHAEGRDTEASGNQAHAEGRDTKAVALGSHAGGRGTVAYNNNMHVRGMWNECAQNSDGSYASDNLIDVVGGGTSDEDRQNIETLDSGGNKWLRGKLRIGGNNYAEGRDYDEYASAAQRGTVRLEVTTDSDGEATLNIYTEDSDD